MWHILFWGSLLPPTRPSLQPCRSHVYDYWKAYGQCRSHGEPHRMSSALLLWALGNGNCFSRVVYWSLLNDPEPHVMCLLPCVARGWRHEGLDEAGKGSLSMFLEAQQRRAFYHSLRTLASLGPGLPGHMAHGSTRLLAWTPRRPSLTLYTSEHWTLSHSMKAYSLVTC